MKKIKFLLPLASSVALISASNAAIVTYSSDVFDNITDVSTNGTLVTAVNLGHGNAAGGISVGTATTAVTVNGVTFISDPGDGTANFAGGPAGTLNTFTANAANDFYGATRFDSSTVITGLVAADADALLDSLEFFGGVGNSLAPLTGLTSGNTYEIQIFTASITHDFGYAETTGGAEVYPLTGVVAGSTTPQIVTGTFIADAASQEIHIASGAGNFEVSAFQLREIKVVPEPSSIMLLSLAGFGLLRRRR